MRSRRWKVMSLLLAVGSLVPITVTCQPAWGVVESWYPAEVWVEDYYYEDVCCDGGYYVDEYYYDDGGGFWFDYWD